MHAAHPFTGFDPNHFQRAALSHVQNDTVNLVTALIWARYDNISYEPGEGPKGVVRAKRKYLHNK